MKKRKMEFTGGIAVLLLLACLMAAPAAAETSRKDLARRKLSQQVPWVIVLRDLQTAVFRQKC